MYFVFENHPDPHLLSFLIVIIVTSENLIVIVINYHTLITFPLLLTLLLCPILSVLGPRL